MERNIRFISGTGKALRLKAQERFLSIPRLREEVHASFTLTACECVLWVAIGIGRYWRKGSDWKSDL